MGFHDTEDFPLENISADIPVRVLWASGDILCPRAQQLPVINRITNFAGEATVPGGHGTSGGSNDSNFMTQLLSLLPDHGVPMNSKVCKKRFDW